MIAPSVNEVPCFGICSVIIAFALHVNEHLNPCSSSNFFASEAVLFRTSCKVIFLIVDVFEFECIKPEGAFYMFVKTPIEIKSCS